MFDIRIINPEETYPLRYKILRPNHPFADCKYTTDHEKGAFHLGGFYKSELISIASFCLENNPDFSNKIQYRLRAMATLEEFRHLGAGRQVVNFAERKIKDIGVEFLWCKGRTTVQEYYEKLGFKRHGETFDYPPIGPHIIMYKRLQ